MRGVASQLRARISFQQEESDHKPDERRGEQGDQDLLQARHLNVLPAGADRRPRQ